MIVDPAAEIFKKSTALFPLPTSTHSHGASVTPLPTVVPEPPVFQHSSDAGTKTLW